MNVLKNRSAVIVLLIVVFVLGIFLGIAYESKKLKKQFANSQVLAPTAYARQLLNKTYNFPIKDTSGKEIARLKYIIQNAELMNQILVNGQPYNAVIGKTFLILNLKLVNNSNQAIQIPTRDYVRLSTNKGQDWLAADIHNDPVQIQAISTKFTRIGFPVNFNTQNLWLQVGEVAGKKDLIKLKLKQS